MKIFSITIRTVADADRLNLETDLPQSGRYPDIIMYVEKKCGEAYVKDNFPGVPYTVVEV